MYSIQYLEKINSIQEHLPEKAGVFLTDENTHQCFNRIGIASERVIVVPQGEGSKSLEIAREIWSRMLDLGLTRQDYMVCIGGGMITDLGAFCATSFKRGIKYIHVPTSLLGMVDASIGGKNAVNFNHIKNLIGTFSEPDKIIICTEFLESLPKREMISGYAEMIKHALIEDRNIWAKLNTLENLEAPPSLEMIRDAATVKGNVVVKDFTEQNIRKLLNFGHTAGHAIESLMIELEQPVSHGEAVAAGMIIESHISSAKGLLSGEDMNEIVEKLQTWYAPIKWAKDQNATLLSFAMQDKKRNDHMLNCTLLQAIGKGVIDQNVTEEEFLEGLNFYQNLK